MSGKRDKTLAIIGVFYVIYWVFDFINNGVMKHDYSWVLWYSAAGFLITGIALIVQNARLLYSMFCALFLIETMWIIDFIYNIFRHETLIGFTEYILSPSFQTKDLLFTLYHVLIPTGLLFAIIRVKKPYKYAWAGAMIFATTLSLLTYFLTGPASRVNCIHSVNQCQTIFSFLYNISNPYRIFIALLGLLVFAYIPTNYILFMMNKNKARVIK